MCVDVCQSGVVVSPKKEGCKAPFIIFAIALKFQDLYLFALLTMFFISLNFEDKNHCSLSNMYSQYLLLGISYISQWNEFQVLFRIRCGSYKGHVYNHYFLFCICVYFLISLPSVGREMKMSPRFSKSSGSQDLIDFF